MKQILCLIGLALLTSTAAFADIARPADTPKPAKAQKSIDTTLTIRIKPDAKGAKLIIPKSQVKQLRAALDDADRDPDATAANVSGFPRTQTVVSGMFLSLAFIFGGVWFVRSGKAAAKPARRLIILAIIAGLGSAATIVFANIGPPLEARSITGKMFSQSVRDYKYGYGRIKLEVRPDGNDEGIELIVPDPQDKSETGE